MHPFRGLIPSNMLKHAWKIKQIGRQKEVGPDFEVICTGGFSNASSKKALWKGISGSSSLVDTQVFEHLQLVHKFSYHYVYSHLYVFCCFYQEIIWFPKHSKECKEHRQKHFKRL
jgi:hypothetical protein